MIGAGGLGHIGIPALRALSQTQIVVVDRSERALQNAPGWGADKTVLARSDHADVKEIRDHTGGVGANVVIDYVAEAGAELEAVDLHLTRRGAVRPEWTTFPLDVVNDTMAALEAGQITGRGVLVPTDGP